MPLPIENNKIRRLTYMALLGALAIVLGIAENSILPALPFLPPGAKPGLSNVVTMFAACTYGFWGALYIIVIKSTFVLLTRGMSAFVMSLAGGVLSGAVMSLLIKLKIEHITYVGISVMAAVSHNIGQLAASIAYTGSHEMIHYLPVLLIFGMISGIITGIIVRITIPKIQLAMSIERSDGGNHE